MQNPHVKYLKAKNGSFYLFYYEQGSILCRCHSSDGWSAPNRVAEQTSSVFSLCQNDNAAHLLYSDIDGKLFMASSTDCIRWEHRSMLEELHNRENTKYFFLPVGDTFHLIYHQPTELTGIDALLYTVFQKGTWDTPYQIDRFLPMQQTPFLARRLSREHIILYYRTGRNVLSAREMLLEPYTMGSVTPLIQTPFPCADLSIVNDKERIHILYIVRGMFRTQVVYQYKYTSAISTPRVIWEDHNCDNCLVYLQKNKVILMWTVNGQPMRCISENNGSSFGAIEKVTDPFPGKCCKGELLGADAASYNCTESYGDLQKSFLPVLFPLTKEPAEVQPLPNYRKISSPLQEQKHRQMEEMTALLAQRSEEIAAVNARWKSQTERLEQELSALRQENAKLKEASREELSES